MGLTIGLSVLSVGMIKDSKGEAMSDRIEHVANIMAENIHDPYNEAKVDLYKAAQQIDQLYRKDHAAACCRAVRGCTYDGGSGGMVSIREVEEAIKQELQSSDE